MPAAPRTLRRWFTPPRWWSGLARLLSTRKKHPFDRAHRVDTDGLIYADPPDDLHNAGYYATAPSLFRGAMELWRGTLAGTGYTVEDYTLVDIGCGKGRVLMLATEYPFREIVGIEIDPRLTRIARKNLRKWTRRVSNQTACHPESPRREPSTAVDDSPLSTVILSAGREAAEVEGSTVDDRPLSTVILSAGREAAAVEGSAVVLRSFSTQRKSPVLGPGTSRVRIIEGDALTVPLPDGPVALFYFNSFEREMTEKWLSRLAEIARTRTAPLDLIYIHPEFDALVRQMPGMCALAEAEIHFSEEDAVADVFGVTSDCCEIYSTNFR